LRLGWFLKFLQRKKKKKTKFGTKIKKRRKDPTQELAGAYKRSIYLGLLKSVSKLKTKYKEFFLKKQKRMNMLLTRRG